jgi:hypothetical protein
VHSVNPAIKNIEWASVENAIEATGINPPARLMITESRRAHARMADRWIPSWGEIKRVAAQMQAVPMTCQRVRLAGGVDTLRHGKEPREAFGRFGSEPGRGLLQAARRRSLGG